MPTLIAREHRDLVDDYVEEVESTLDYEDDDEMAEALEDLNREIAYNKPTHETLARLVSEVSSWLDGNDDAGLQALHERICEIPSPAPISQPSA